MTSSKKPLALRVGGVCPGSLSRERLGPSTVQAKGSLRCPAPKTTTNDCLSLLLRSLQGHSQMSHRKDAFWSSKSWSLRATSHGYHYQSEIFKNASWNVSLPWPRLALRI